MSIQTNKHFVSVLIIVVSIGYIKLPNKKEKCGLGSWFKFKFFFIFNAQHIIVPAERLGCEPSASHFNGLAPCLPAITSSMYLVHFLSLASSIRFSQGTVSSKRIICLEHSEIISGLSDVMATVSGNLICFDVIQHHQLPFPPCLDLNPRLGNYWVTGLTLLQHLPSAGHHQFFI